MLLSIDLTPRILFVPDAFYLPVVRGFVWGFFWDFFRGGFFDLALDLGRAAFSSGFAIFTGAT